MLGSNQSNLLEMINNKWQMNHTISDMNVKRIGLGLGSVICHLLFIISLLFPFNVSAQGQTFTEHLTQTVPGAGTVTLHQDAEIEALVNGTKTPAPAVRQPHVLHTPDTTALQGESHTAREITGHRAHSVGYRIQVYAGGNNRQSKAEAYRIAGLVRSYFSHVPVYTIFASPRWVCRVGDFKTREEAVEQLRKLRETNQFSEASIVKSKIVVYY